MTVKLLTEHYLEFLSLKGDCTGSSESTLVKMLVTFDCTVLYLASYDIIMIIGRNKMVALLCRNIITSPLSEIHTSALL